MTKNCQSCNTKFDGRKDAKSCSARCRKRLQRTKATFLREAGAIKDAVTEAVSEVGQELSGGLKPEPALVSAEDVPEDGVLGSVTSDEPEFLDLPSEPKIEEYSPATVQAPASPPLITPQAPPPQPVPTSQPPVRPEEDLAPEVTQEVPETEPSSTLVRTEDSQHYQPPARTLFETPPDQPITDLEEIHTQEPLETPQPTTVTASTARESYPIVGEAVKPEAAGEAKPVENLLGQAAIVRSAPAANSFMHSTDMHRVTPYASEVAEPSEIAGGTQTATPMFDNLPPKRNLGSIFSFFAAKPFAIAAVLVLLVGISAGVVRLFSAQDSEQPAASQEESLSSLGDEGTIRLNLDTELAPGKKLSLAQLDVAPGTLLQVTGDVQSSGTLFASNGQTSLSNSGLTINNSLVCSASGCIAGATAANTITGEVSLINLPPEVTIQGNSFNSAGQLVQLNCQRLAVLS